MKAVENTTHERCSIQCDWPTRAGGYLDRESELWIGVMQQDNGFWHSHTLPHPNVVEQSWLLHRNGQIHHSDISIVETIQNISFPEIQSIKLNVGQLCLQAGN